ncbi:MAG: hypothetical protein ACYSTL_06125 [Planctomycetota bacterium]
MVAAILILTGIALALVQLRRREIVIRHEIQRLEMCEVVLRRRLWDQQVRLGYLTGPQEIRRRVTEISLKQNSASDELVRANNHGETPVRD